MEVVYEIKGADGRILQVKEDCVAIASKGIRGFISRGLAGSKSIYYSDITAVEFKEAGWTAGYIEFIFPGSSDQKGGAMSGVNNENRITFGKPTIGAAKKLNLQVLEIKKFIDQKIMETKKQSQGTTIINNSTSSKSEELINLKNLLDAGAISQDEFEKLKVEVLNK